MYIEPKKNKKKRDGEANQIKKSMVKREAASIKILKLTFDGILVKAKGAA